MINERTAEAPPPKEPNYKNKDIMINKAQSKRPPLCDAIAKGASSSL